MPTYNRLMSAWKNVHDNGWITNAVEMPDGRWTAWAAPDATASAPDYVEDTPENAMRATTFALERKSGHDACSDRCSGWTAEQHQFQFTKLVH